MKRLLVLLVLLANVGAASAQVWPSKPIRLICPYPGGPVDLSSRAINPSLMPNLPYDPIRDFRFVALVVQVPNVLIVNTDLPAKNVAELIALARLKPGRLDFGSGSTGSTGL